MTYNINIVCILLMLVMKILKPVNLQFGMPLYGPPMFPPPAPVFPPVPVPVPAPIPMMAPVLVPVASSSSEEGDKTKTKKSKSKKCPPPPSFNCKRPKSHKKPPCPPCMCKPSCTPSFFSYCSPCHKKCRCKKVNSNDSDSSYEERVPVPMPPIIAPQPLVLVPYPPPIPRPMPPRRRPRKKLRPYYSSDDSSYSSSSESDYFRRRRHRKYKRQNIHRRSLRSSENDKQLLKPMLSYVADNGDVKFKTKISNDDVAVLLGEKKPKKVQTVQVLTRDDEMDNPQVVVISKDEDRRRDRAAGHKQVLLRGGMSNHVLSDGKKELIFRPPADKKISNLSVSFQIS